MPKLFKKKIVIGLSVILLSKSKNIVNSQVDSRVNSSKSIVKVEDSIEDVFKLLKKKDWEDALKLSEDLGNRLLYNLVNYLDLKRRNNSRGFKDYVKFIENNPNYPRQGRLRYLAEMKIDLNNISAEEVIGWFSKRDPVSEYGRLKLGESNLLVNKNEIGIDLIKKSWEKVRLTNDELKELLGKHKDILGGVDNIERVDWHAWEGKHRDVKRIVPYLPKDKALLYKARGLLISQSSGVDNAIYDLPDSLRSDIGLTYDRLKWRRKKGMFDKSLDILKKLPLDTKNLVRPYNWWKERKILIRPLIYKKKYKDAYELSSNHFLLKNTKGYLDAEWLSGWISLVFLKRAKLAQVHFTKFYNNVSKPINVSSGAYWLGRTYKELGDTAKSIKWFSIGAKYIRTYYGQLSFIEINPTGSFELEDESDNFSNSYEKEFNKNSLKEVINILYKYNRADLSRDFINHLSNDNIKSGSKILASKLSIKVDCPDIAVKICRKACYKRKYYDKFNYPIIDIPKKINNQKIPNPEIVLALIRQESEFNSKAYSGSKARGLMQLMPMTAKIVARQAKMSYSKSRLLTDSEYNIKLGCYLLGNLLNRYKGSYPFILVAYNAGPGRVNRWRKVYGDPTKGEIDYINWIELIKFGETRNYVKRVIESINVYKYMLYKKPIKIENFFGDRPVV
jgi:soluble lytic murein transglycosylase